MNNYDHPDPDEEWRFRVSVGHNLASIHAASSSGRSIYPLCGGKGRITIDQSYGDKKVTCETCKDRLAHRVLIHSLHTMPVDQLVLNDHDKDAFYVVGNLGAGHRCFGTATAAAAYVRSLSPEEATGEDGDLTAWLAQMNPGSLDCYHNAYPIFVSTIRLDDSGAEFEDYDPWQAAREAADEAEAEADDVKDFDAEGYWTAGGDPPKGAHVRDCRCSVGMLEAGDLPCALTLSASDLHTVRERQA